jgi:hypothetical protein
MKKMKGMKMTEALKQDERAGRFSWRSEISYGCGEGDEDARFSSPEKSQRRMKIVRLLFLGSFHT